VERMDYVPPSETGLILSISHDRRTTKPAWDRKYSNGKRSEFGFNAVGRLHHPRLCSKKHLSLRPR